MKGENVQPVADRVMSAARLSGLSHAAFRLYVILDGASRQSGLTDEYFPVTLKGLLELHPGVAGRRASAIAVLKQVAELRRQGLVELRAALSRTQPELPVLVRVLAPRGTEGQRCGVAAVIASR